jgi:endothelin-converting enzyme/putative endopeptidase
MCSKLFSPSKSNTGIIFSLLFAAALHAQSPSQSGLDLSAIDKSVSPCDNFYQYACGTWLKNNPIPADESSWGRFNVMHDNNQKILRGILEDSEAHPDRSATDQKIGGFYKSCMDEGALDALGKKPILPELDRIQQIKDSAGLLAEVTRMHLHQSSVLFNFSSSPDPHNARQTIADLDQGGLGLPEKDFYLRTDARSQEIRTKYVAHIAKMFELLGVEPAAAAQERRPHYVRGGTAQAQPRLQFPGFLHRHGSARVPHAER